MLRITIIACAIIALTSIAKGEQECEGYSTEQCETFVIGVATAYVNGIGRVEDFIEPMQVQFKKAIANVSNDYVILQVLPKHVLIVDVTYSTNDRVVVHFLVVNPSGSTVLPVAFRSHELYLMCKLNDDEIDKMLDYSIVPIEPESDYKLAIPAWAIAISCYVGLVAVCYITYTVYQANRQFKNMEDRMEDYEMQSSMEKGHNLRLHIDVNGTADQTDSPTEKGTQVRQHQITTETSMVEVTVETPTSKLGENDEIPPPYTSDNGSSAGSSTSGNTVERSNNSGDTIPSEVAIASTAAKDVDTQEISPSEQPVDGGKTYETDEDDIPAPPPPLSAPEDILPADESLPPPPSPEELNDTTGLTQGEQEATAALDGVVNDGFQDDDEDEDDEMTSL